MKDIPINEFKYKEYSYLFKEISNGDQAIEAEILEARNQKNALGNQHLFDVLVSRGSISYNTIASAWKKVIQRVKGKKRRVLLNKKSIDIEVRNGKCYLIQEPDVEVQERFSISATDINGEVRDKRPIIIIPKDTFDAMQIKKAQQLSGSVAKYQNFTLTDILKEAIDKGTSDIHFNFDIKGQYHVGFKINGRFIRQKHFTMNHIQSENFFNIVRQKMALDTGSSFKSEEYNLPQGGTLRYDELGVDLRGQFTPSGKMDKANKFVCRILKKQASATGKIKDLNGYDGNFKEMLKEISQLQQGLVLVVGVTNSGKSTLTAHFINDVPDDMVVGTISDPIEYPKNKPNVTEHQILDTDDKDTSVDFLDYIKSFKRSDLDVIEIAEIRADKENALMKAVVEAVTAGQLVVSTIHIRSAFEVPIALMEIFDVNPAVIPSLMKIVIAQTLVEEICPYCRVEDTENKNKNKLKKMNDMGLVKFSWKKDLTEWLEDESSTSYIRNPDGCPYCSGTGIKGLTPIYEYYNPTVEAQDWLSENIQKTSISKVEQYFCSQEKRHVAINKLTCFMEKLKNGQIDTDSRTIARVFS